MKTTHTTTPATTSGCGSRTTINGKPVLYQNAKAIFPATYNIHQP